MTPESAFKEIPQGIIVMHLEPRGMAAIPLMETIEDSVHRKANRIGRLKDSKCGKGIRWGEENENAIVTAANGERKGRWTKGVAGPRLGKENDSGWQSRPGRLHGQGNSESSVVDRT